MLVCLDGPKKAADAFDRERRKNILLLYLITTPGGRNSHVRRGLCLTTIRLRKATASWPPEKHFSRVPRERKEIKLLHFAFTRTASERRATRSTCVYGRREKERATSRPLPGGDRGRLSHFWYRGRRRRGGCPTSEREEGLSFTLYLSRRRGKRLYVNSIFFKALKRKGATFLHNSSVSIEEWKSGGGGTVALRATAGGGGGRLLDDLAE